MRRGQQCKHLLCRCCGCNVCVNAIDLACNNAQANYCQWLLQPSAEHNCDVFARNGKDLLLIPNIIWVSNELQAFVVHGVVCQLLDQCVICCVGT